jgi:hypothetical protein
MKLPREYMTKREWEALEASGMAWEFYPEGPPEKFARECPACIMEPVDGWCPYHPKKRVI